MTEFTLSVSTVAEKGGNTYYAHRVTIKTKEDLMSAVKFDHVAGVFYENRRSIKNFLWSDVIFLDVDNDHTERPEDWMTPEKIIEDFNDLEMYIVPSRNHWKDKRNGKNPRPKFHLYIPIPLCKNAESYAKLKVSLQKGRPYIDANALDAARTVFATEHGEEIIANG